MKKIISLALAVILLSALLSVTTFASGVTYNGKTQEFEFDNGTTDLFENFKNVMPGDKLTQEIVVKNLPASGMQVQMLMRSKGEVTEDPSDLMSKLILRVKSSDGRIVSSSKADEAGTIGDWVDLGTYETNRTIKLTVELEVPIEIGNEYNLGQEIHALKWEFKINEEEVEPSHEGDTALYVTVGVAALAIVSLCGLVIIKKKNKNEQ